MAKEKKTERELIELLMAELRKHPECAHVMDVTIIRPTSQNWQAAWVVDGIEMACRRAFSIADELQAKFDLA